MHARVTCPTCKKLGLNIAFNVHEIPYFGEVMESTVICKHCKYRHADVFVLEEKEPARYTLGVDSEKDMLVRVVRSSKGHISIPELGLEMSPGPEAEGFISNVEGVLARFEDVLFMAKSWSDAKKVRDIERLLKKIRKIKDGRMKVRLIVEDPSGNSAIISEKAVKKKLSTAKRNL